ncbi:MAG: undecaprenyldiphospho-muramoylpentapeptide beta-N-acetylglucosaminyltransferase [Xanthomonadaceae bacterium]|nr:undecaprenyldiphospho-muramoylpentapeptide beta-N-acetylglucosaminyltransferase [Xanthomonadaceae bacterium]
MTAKSPVMIMAGGTGGHIFPGLAVAEALRLRGVPVLWLGSEGGMETRLVSEHGIAIETLAIKGLRGKDLRSLLLAPWRIFTAVRKATALIRRHKPAAVVSFGGYTAGPGGLAAWLQGRPLLVHEQNRAPGMTNRLLARIADQVMTGFPDSFLGIANQVVGNPVRPEISALPAPAMRFADRDGVLRVLILGGSQGARAINESLPGIFASLQSTHRFAIRHQCGEKMLEQARATYTAAGVDAVIEPFITDMAEAYGWADVVIGRAGALTVAEICAAGVAGILIPLPTAVDDHQARNAEYLQHCGGGLWFRQDEALTKNIAHALSALAADPQRRLVMAGAARAAAYPQAANDVADLIVREMAA